MNINLFSEESVAYSSGTLLPDIAKGTPDPFRVAFNIGNFPIYWYAILTLIGYILAIGIYHAVLKWRYKVNVEVGFYFVFAAIPCIFLGARIWSCIIETGFENFFNFREGGLAVQGGVLGGLIAAFIYFPIILKFPKFHKRVVENGNVYIQKPSMWLYADAIIPVILIGQAIGRWGNFFNGEIFGQLVTENPNQPNSLWWLKSLMPGVYDHMISKNNSGGLILGALYQPLFLYESFFNIMLFLIIYLFIPFFKEIKAGVISGSYFLGYGIIRMITESMRDNNFKNTETFIMNGILLGAGLIIIIYTQFINNWLRNYKVWKIFIDSNKNWVNKIKLNNLNNKLSKNEISKNDFNLRVQDIRIIEKFNLNYIKQNYKKIESEMCFYDGR
ncbi:MAG: prolipoprotein diacylglyceryl transferase [Ureaplasma sp.]|nr:prolipoprotein diacylglyceryl transferase [Ureaplasma sp.]